MSSRSRRARFAARYDANVLPIADMVADNGPSASSTVIDAVGAALSS